MEKVDLYSLLKQLNACGGMAEIGQSGFCLLMALWQKANELHWTNQFSMTNAELIFKSGYNSERAMTKKRQRLMDLGYFKYVSSKNRKNCGTYIMNYCLTDNYQKRSVEGSSKDGIKDGIKDGNGDGNKFHSEFRSEFHSEFHSEDHINKLNETKQTKQIKESTPAPSKTLFLEFVLLTQEEYQKLLKKLGEDQTRKYIERLNGYIGQIGEKTAKKKYASHYFTILNWARKDGISPPAEKKTVDPQPVNNEEHTSSGYQKTESQILFEREKEELREAEKRRAAGYVPNWIKQRELARQRDGGGDGR
jgi:hypothetical protein